MKRVKTDVNIFIHVIRVHPRPDPPPRIICPRERPSLLCYNTPRVGYAEFLVNPPKIQGDNDFVSELKQVCVPLFRRNKGN